MISEKELEKLRKEELKKIPRLPKELPSVSLPLGGGELVGLADFSSSTPSEETLTFSLLTQLAPLMANTATLMKILKVFKALEKFSQNPLSNGPELFESIQGINTLIVRATIPQYGAAKSIKQALDLIVRFLDSFVPQLEYNLKLQAKLNQGLKLAHDNPVLKAHLECAQNNAKFSMKSLEKSIAPLRPLIDSIGSIMDIVGMDEKLKEELEKQFKEIYNSINFSEISDIKDLEKAIKRLERLEELVGEFEKIINTV